MIGTLFSLSLNIFYFISHGKGFDRAKMLCHSPLPSHLAMVMAGILFIHKAIVSVLLYYIPK